MRTLGLMSVLCVAITACSTAESHRFSVRPYGQLDPLKETKPQEHGPRIPTPNLKNFRELTIAQGSGLGGYDTIRLFADRTGYAVTGHAGSGGVQIPLRLSASQWDALLIALRRDGINRLKASYRADVADGAQRFVELVTSAGRVHTWLDNYFEPVAHTYRFCNAEIWPEVQHRILRHSFGKRHDLQEEYYRVFPEDNPARLPQS